MIVKMKKLSLLLYHGARQDFLEGLQRAGVVHLTQNRSRDMASMHKSAEAVRERERVRQALDRLKRGVPCQRRDKDPDQVMAEFATLCARRDELGQLRQRLEKEAEVLAPWGDFDPAMLKRLASAGVAVRFFRCPARQYAAIDKRDGNIEEICRRDGRVSFVAILKGPPAFDAEEVHLPDESLGAVRQAIARADAEQQTVTRALSQLGAYADILAECCVEEKNRHSYRAAEANLQGIADDKLFWFTGFFPKDKEKELSEFLRSQPVSFEITDPAPEDDVPVLVRNGPLTKLYEPLLRLYSLPAYTDIDPTVFIAPFFTLFVGLCIGDVAYGAIILLGSTIAWFKVSKAIRPFFTLGMILGVMTILAGFMLNSVFGRAIFGGPGVSDAIFSTGEAFAFFSPYHGAHGTAYPMMNFALFIGFVQVALAFVLRTVNKFMNGSVSDGLAVFSFLVMLVGALAWGAQVNFLNMNFGGFSINTLHVGKVLLMIPKDAGIALMLGGLLVFMVFGNRDKSMGGRIAQNFLDFYNGVTGIFGNILSYLRLFALGLAGGMLAMVFNQMAFMLITDPAGHIHYTSPLIVATILLLVVGHALNFALSMVGAFVHPLRLTFVEFLQNIDLSWGGKEYAPFAEVKLESNN